MGVKLCSLSCPLRGESEDWIGFLSVEQLCKAFHLKAGPQHHSFIRFQIKSFNFRVKP